MSTAMAHGAATAQCSANVTVRRTTTHGTATHGAVKHGAVKHGTATHGAVKHGNRVTEPRRRNGTTTTHSKETAMPSPTWADSDHIRRMARDRLRRAKDPCWICGQPIDYSLASGTPDSFELDHRLPISRYPELAFDHKNHAASHKRCNRAKSDKEYAPIIRRSGALK